VTVRALADRAATSTGGRSGWPGVGRRGDIDIRLLGTFELTFGGRSIPVGLTAQRLLTLLAIRSGQVPRSQAAGVLWPDATATRAAANLRSVLWRLQRCCSAVIEVSYYDLRLAHAVTVDVHRVLEASFDLIDPGTDLSADQLRAAVRCNLYEDIALDLGDEEWLAAERERFRQLRVHCLEALSRRLTAAGWHGAAVNTALGAVRADPFRESAYRLLIEAHLVEGSRLEARRQHSAYRRLLRTELGLSPSQEFMSLLADGEPNATRRQS
jgi:DNA-binding SARP family transcriptional activator